MQNTPATTDEFTAQCGCGKRYRVAAEKRGRKLKCHACGGTYAAEPAPPKTRSTPTEGTPTKPPAHADHAVNQATEHALEHSAPAEPAPVSPSASSAVAHGVRAEPIDPAPLLKDLSRGNLPALVAVALVLHILVIGITSVGHVSLCMKYHTLWPKPVMKKEREEEEKRKLEEKLAQQQKALEEKQAAQAARKSEGPAAKPGPDETKNGKPKSKIERTLEEKSNERPKEGTIRLDEPGSLE